MDQIDDEWQEVLLQSLRAAMLWLKLCLPVTKPGTEEVRQGEEPGEDPLRDDDRAPEEEPGLLQLQEREEVHPLILGLLLEHHTKSHEVLVALLRTWLMVFSFRYPIVLH